MTNLIDAKEALRRAELINPPAPKPPYDARWPKRDSPDRDQWLNLYENRGRAIIAEMIASAADEGRLHLDIARAHKRDKNWKWVSCSDDERQEIAYDVLVNLYDAWEDLECNGYTVDIGSSWCGDFMFGFIGICWMTNIEDRPKKRTSCK
ncbi:MAG TPA: hypothetical protein PLU88_03215 [Armatimonadota bacterium]|nr:hypothetical protein [Armatimonadota bacterium]HPP74122.1 hypothetical protein [Armatimonadota bacterium]